MPNFSNILQQKLSTHELPIDSTFWAEMQERLQPTKRRRIVPLWWLASGIAASVALLVLLNFNNKNFTQSSQRIAQSPQKNYENAPVIENTQRTEQKKEHKLHKPHKFSQNNYIANSANIVNIVENNNDTINNKQQANQQINKSTNRQEIEKYAKLMQEQNRKTENRKNEIVNRKSFIAMAHVGGGWAGQSRGEKMMFDNASPPLASDGGRTDAENGYLAGIENDGAKQSLEELMEEYPKISYLPPISAGFSVCKNFTKRIALETGLFYTYLHTKLHYSNDWQQQNAALKVHYLGIPINLIVYIFDKPKWNLYFSVGGAIEKGLRLDYKKITTYTYSPEIYTQHLNDNVKRVQLSVNTAFGISARIYQGFGVYFEPRFGYYFKNQQPMSIRTASPFNIGLNAGIRYEF